MSRGQPKKNPRSSYKAVYYILSQAKPFYPFIGFALFLIFVEVVLMIFLLPRVLEIIINVAEKNPGKAWFRLLKGWVVCFLGLQIMVELVVRLEDYLLSVRVLPRLRSHLYEHNVARILRKEYAFYERSVMGKLSENLARITDVVPEIVETFVLKLAFFMLSFGCVIYVFYTVDLFLALLLFLFFSWLMLLLVVFNKRISLISNNWSYKAAMVAGRVMDLLSNIQLVRLFVGRKRERKNLKVMLRRMMDQEAGLHRTYLTMFALAGLGYILFQGACFYFLLRKGCQGLVTVGQLAVVVYINETLMSLVWYDLPDLAVLSMQFGEVEQALEGVEAGKDERDVPHAKPLCIDEGAILFDNVHFRFEPDGPAFFENFNLAIPAKQKVGIVGYAGSGKSTFLKMLLRLYPIDQGKIAIDGQDIRYVTGNSLRLNIGVVLQNLSLFQRPLLENVRYGNFQATSATLTQALHDAQVYDLVMAPAKKHIDCNQDFNWNVSGGQKQKLSIARAILKNAPILVFDEPTSHLDASTECHMQAQLDLLMKDKTVIVIAHRLPTVMKMNRILVFDKGKIVEDGTHESLLAKQGRYAELWHSQIGKEEHT